jgi:hypothetical protein
VRSLFHRVKSVGNYLAERREADRFQPEGWETAEGRALLSQYRADGLGQGAKVGLNGWDAVGESPGQTPTGPLNGAALPGAPMPAARSFAATTPPAPTPAAPGPAVPTPAAPMPAVPTPAAPGPAAGDATGLVAPVEITGPSEPSAGRGVARVPRQRFTDVTRPVGASRGVARVAPPASDDGTPPASRQGTQPAPNEIARPSSTEVARPAFREPAAGAVARHRSDEVAAEMNHRPRHDGTQAQVESGYLLTREPTIRHGGPVGPDGARVLTVTNVVRAPDGSPLAGAIVTISLFADCATPGFLPDSTIDGVARIITPEEGELIAEWTPESEVVAMDTHYQVAELTEEWPEGRDLVQSRPESRGRQG